MSITIESVEQYDQILKNNEYVLVDYNAKWCKPCTQLSPRIEEIAQKYSHLKVLKVDYDLLDEIIDREKIEKLPTLKTFHNGEPVKSTIGVNMEVIFAQLEELLQLGNSIVAQTKSIPAQPQSLQPITPKSTTAPQNIQLPAFAHPADASAGMSNVPIGSSRMSHLKPAPPELIQFQSTLASFSVILFTHASQSTSPANNNSSSYGAKNNIVDQTVTDLKLLIDASKTPLMFKHVVISDTDENSKILAQEYGATELKQLPIIKLLYKKVCYATFIKGDTFEVEKKLLDFVQL